MLLYSTVPAGAGELILLRDLRIHSLEKNVEKIQIK